MNYSIETNEPLLEVQNLRSQFSSLVIIENNSHSNFSMIQVDNARRESTRVAPYNMARPTHLIDIWKRKIRHDTPHPPFESFARSNQPDD